MFEYQVERSIVIDADINHVRTSLCNFTEWPVWSPWLITEPDAILTFSEQQGSVGANYHWLGHIIGEGHLSITEINDDNIKMDIVFVKPFKSKAKVSFHLQAQGSQTGVIWRMEANMPFFLFFMIKSIKASIGLDYERGLRMLKEYLENNSVASQSQVIGLVEQSPIQYIGINNHSRLNAIGDIMPNDFSILEKVLALHAQNTKKIAFSIYHTFDIQKNHTEFTTAFPLDTPIDAPDDCLINTLPAQKMLKIRHIGKYEHLGNAWAMGMGYCRANQYKLKPSPVGVEFYISDPKNTAPEDLVTEVLIPIK